jgi:hypothetical protein
MSGDWNIDNLISYVCIKESIIRIPDTCYFLINPETSFAFDYHILFIVKSDQIVSEFQRTA